MTEAQKKAQKKYDDKTKVVSIKYTPANMKDYEKLKQYLEQTNQSMNGFIKKLVNEFFKQQEMNNKTKETRQSVIKSSKEEEKRHELKYYQPYSYIELEYFQLLMEYFGEDTMNKVLQEYYELIDYEINDNLIEIYGENFESWLDDVKDRIELGEIETGTTEEIRKKLIKDMYNYM